MVLFKEWKKDGFGQITEQVFIHICPENQTHQGHFEKFLQIQSEENRVTKLHTCR